MLIIVVGTFFFFHSVVYPLLMMVVYHTSTKYLCQSYVCKYILRSSWNNSIVRFSIQKESEDTGVFERKTNIHKHKHEHPKPISTHILILTSQLKWVLSSVNFNRVFSVSTRVCRYEVWMSERAFFSQTLVPILTPTSYVVR